jgi:hypothetical protein
MRPQVALPSLIVALLLAALAVAGCGGGDDASASADASPSQLLDQTFGADARIKSGRLTLGFDAEVQGVGDPIVLKLSGPFQSSTSKDELPKFAFDLSVTTDGKTGEYGAVSTGDKGFLKYLGTDFAVPDQLFKQFADGYANVQTQADADRGATPSLKSLGIDPRAWLTDPQRAGEAKVGDTETIHLTAGIDTAKLLADVQKAAAKAGSVSGQARQLSAADVDQLGKAVKSASVDVYTGKQDTRLRKFVLDLQLTTGHVVITLQYDDLDAPQDIQAPANAQSLAGLTGALSGAGSSSGGGQSTTPAPSGGANARYLGCVERAGQDIAKIQACAKYL